MTYAELPVPQPLQPWVAALWSVDGSTPVRVLPDGCVDVVVTPSLGAHVVGPMSRATVVTGGGFGLRVQIGAGAALLGRPVDELVDDVVLLGWPVDDLADLARRAAELASRARTPDPLVASVVKALDRPRPDALPALAAALCLGERQLRRRVEAATGHAPRRLARVLRLQRAVARLRDGAALADAAADAGYADQPHLARECRSLALATPRRLAEEVRNVHDGDASAEASSAA